jgi:hypothetical protein
MAEKPERFVCDKYGLFYLGKTYFELKNKTIRLSKGAIIFANSCLFCGRQKTWEEDVLFYSNGKIKMAVTICPEDMKKNNLHDIRKQVRKLKNTIKKEQVNF